MKNIISNSYYEVSIIDSLAIIYLKGNIFQLLMSNEDNKRFLALLNKFQYDPKIKALFFYNNPGVFGEGNYENFLLFIMGESKKDDEFEIPQFSDKDIRTWEIRRLDEYVIFLASYKKLCFTLLSGDVITPFFGASLALDIRYSTPDMYFSLAHLKYGLHPSAGLPYFLVQQLGYNKAMELLLKDRISAEEALELGLINRIVKSDNPVDEIIKEIQSLTNIRTYTIRKTKQLASFTRSTIFDYFQYERTLLGI